MNRFTESVTFVYGRKSHYNYVMNKRPKITEQTRKTRIHNWIIAITVAILYIVISLITQKWEYTWIIWVAYCFYRVATEYMIKRQK